MIIVVVALVALMIFFCVAMTYCYCRRKRKREATQQPAISLQETSSETNRPPPTAPPAQDDQPPPYSTFWTPGEALWHHITPTCCVCFTRQLLQSLHHTRCCSSCCSVDEQL